MTTLVTLMISALAGCGSGIVSAPVQPVATPSAPTATALGPQLGYLWIASDQTLRPILGIPGAAQVGKSVVPAGVYINAATSASAGLAVLQSADGSLYRMALPSGSPVTLGVTIATGAKLRLSPSANAMLAFTSGSSSAVLVVGLTSSPKVQTIAAPAPISNAVVSDFGTVAFESSRSIFISPLNLSPVPLASIAAPGGLSFLPATAINNDDLLFADSGANSLTLVRAAASGPSSQTIPISGLLQFPSDLGVSASGRWALIVNSGSRTAVRVELSSLAVSAVTCVCQPTLAEPLADDGAFRVTNLASGPNWLVDAAASTPRALFIPARAGTGNLTTASAVLP